MTDVKSPETIAQKLRRAEDMLENEHRDQSREWRWLFIELGGAMCIAEMYFGVPDSEYSEVAPAPFDAMRELLLQKLHRVAEREQLLTGDTLAIEDVIFALDVDAHDGEPPC